MKEQELLEVLFLFQQGLSDWMFKGKGAPISETPSPDREKEMFYCAHPEELRSAVEDLIINLKD